MLLKAPNITTQEAPKETETFFRYNPAIISQVDSHDVRTEYIRFQRAGRWYQEPQIQHPTYLVCPCNEAERIRKMINDHWENL